jgi:hypothetical protein
VLALLLLLLLLQLLLLQLLLLLLLQGGVQPLCLLLLLLPKPQCATVRSSTWSQWQRQAVAIAVAVLAFLRTVCCNRNRGKPTAIYSVLSCNICSLLLLLHSLNLPCCQGLLLLLLLLLLLHRLQAPV